MKKMAVVVFAVAVVMTAVVSAAAPVYSPENVVVSPDAVRCRVMGVPTVEDDLFCRQGFWKITNHKNRLEITPGGVYDGVKGLYLQGPVQALDTAWNARTEIIPLKGVGRRFRLGFFVTSTIKIRLRVTDGSTWCGCIVWQGADGKKISSTGHMLYSVGRGRLTEVSISGDIPEDAVSFYVRFGFDYPNIQLGNAVVFSGFSFEELTERESYAPKAGFVSEVHSGGGRVTWLADLPEGTAARFQWRGADSVESLLSMPFKGPDGTSGTHFADPFTADAAFVQYRVTLLSDGRSTPALREVRVGGKADRDWTLEGDVKPPRVRRLSPSPTLNGSETLRISVKDAATCVRWDSLKVVVDGVDRTADFRREGDVISLEARSVPWSHGIHTADVSVTDFHGNSAQSRKMFFVGEPPKTPKVSVRDDGMTLIDGKPFFPIGIYGVCRREFNGFNLDTAFKGLKEAGFNLAHTYGNSWEPEFLGAARKYGIRLWVAARYPGKLFTRVARHNPDIIAWYLGDDTSDHISPELEADYDEAVKAVDPTRITVQADPILASADGLSYEGASRYAPYVTATDGFMPEIYPVRKKAGDETDRTCVARTIRDMKQFKIDVSRYGEGKPRTCWAIMQYFKGWSHWGHFPTREQLFATTFAAIIHGANGVTWYTYGGFKENEGVTSTPERWRTISELATRLSVLAPVFVERTPQQPPAPEVLSGPKTDPLEMGPSVTCLLKRHNGMCYLFAVNATPEHVSARLTLKSAGSVEVLYEDRVCAVSDGCIMDEFAPFAVHIYRWREPGKQSY